MQNIIVLEQPKSMNETVIGAANRAGMYSLLTDLQSMEVSMLLKLAYAS